VPCRHLPSRISASLGSARTWCRLALLSRDIRATILFPWLNSTCHELATGAGRRGSLLPAAQNYDRWATLRRRGPSGSRGWFAWFHHVAGYEIPACSIPPLPSFRCC